MATVMESDPSKAGFAEAEVMGSNPTKRTIMLIIGIYRHEKSPLE